MVFHCRVAVPSSFRPDHQAGRVLTHVAVELGARREVVGRDGERLVIEGVAHPGWNARFSGRGVVAFERHPPPGAFTVSVSVLREVLCTASGFAVGAVIVWLGTGSGREALVLAGFAFGLEVVS